MNLALTEEQSLLQKTVREFAEAEVKPRARELDETGHFPRDLFAKAAELGLTGVPFPDSEGGAGFDHIAYTIVIEEVSRCCASTGVILSVQNSLYCDPIHRIGTDDGQLLNGVTYTSGFNGQAFHFNGQGSEVRFDAVKTPKLRIVFTNNGKARSGVTEVLVWEE